MPDSGERTDELEAVVVGADEIGDVRVGFDARLELVDAYGRHAGTWRMLDPLDWCLAASDRDPDRFDAVDLELLRWCHRLVVTRICGTPRVDLARIRSTLDDLERRQLAGGRGPRPLHAIRCHLADHMGDEAGARAWLERWQTGTTANTAGTGSADAGDCAGCDLSAQAALRSGWGDSAAAVRTVEAIGSAAVAGCSDQPERGLVTVLLPLLRLGRHDEAAWAHVEAYRRHRHERPAFPYLGEHLRFCALAGQHRRGLEILTRHLGWLDRPTDERSAMEFAAAGALVCRLADEAGLATPTVSELGAELAATARDLGQRFDARNGTTHQSRRMASWLSERPVSEPIPVPPDDDPDDWAAPPTTADPTGWRRWA